MLDIFANKIQSKLDNIGRKTTLTEEDLRTELREVRRILVEADVNYQVAKEFCKEVQKEAIDSNILIGLNPGEQVVKLVKDKMVEFLQGDNQFNVKKNDIILMVGLQGSGKTTTTGKLAHLLSKKQGFNPLLVACDVYRPAAIDQLHQVGGQLGISVYSEKDNNDVISISKHALDYAKEHNHDLVIIDTAGRTHVDEMMMEEIKNLEEAINPQHTLLVIDGTIGQIAVDIANDFNNYVNVNGLIFTKMDSDTRGGAILSVKKATNIDIKYLGVSEKMNGLEVFDAKRVVGRILGEGDMIGLIEKAEEYAEEHDLEADAQRMLEGKFDMNDYLKQIKSMKKMGGFKNLLKMIPGMNKLDTSMIDEREFVRIQAIIESMTPKERAKPAIINGSRRKRIAKGSGTTVQDVNKLLKNYENTKTMMKRLRNMDMSQMANLFK